METEQSRKKTTNTQDPGEAVYVIEEWYDGPRTGFADYRGVPHFYRSLYLDLEDYADFDPNEDRFELTPASSKVMEWATAADSLPAGNASRQELWDLIEQRLSEQQGQSFIVHGHFPLGCKVVQWKKLT